MFLSKGIILLFYITILLSINFGKVVSTSYTCNVDQDANINPNSQNYCSFQSSYSVTCLKINDCINSLNNIGNSNIYSIALVNSHYSYDGNCDLVIKSSSQWSFRSLGINSTIDCQSKGSFIKSSISSMAFSNLIITNTINSAIISNSSNSLPVITVSHVTFINCTTNGDGGALQIQSPNLINVINSNFNSCSAANKGGAILSQSNLIIHSSSFILNSANDGGAIYSSQTTIRNVAFINNTAISTGGAVSSLELDIQGSTVKNNTAAMGGALYIQGIQSQYTDFYYNSANEGGAIYIHDTISNSLLNGNNIRSNFATNGGGIYVAAPTDNGKLNLTGTLIYENQAGSYGGGVYFNKSSTPFIFNGKIYNNTAYAQRNSKQQELACDRFSHVNCNLCGITNCNLCQENQGICIKIKSKSSSSSSGSSNSKHNSSSKDSSENISSSGEDSSDNNSNSNNNNNNDKISYKQNNYIDYFEDDNEDYLYYNSGDSEKYLCLLTSFGCDHGKCSLFFNSTSKKSSFECECQHGFWGSTCEGDSSASLSSSSESESYSESGSSVSPPNDSSNSNGNTNSKTMLALEISLPIVLGFLIIVFIVTLYFVLRRRDEVIEITNEDIRPLINESISDRNNYL
ncbi:hypothetical protein DICPUDRAFT_156068 [Dictyostelium purpureum]|uniref:EGF-like domain-containing protein n=1 Tax=Dictyostelium purpureum TaxID=5786 RepID=F0ZVM0_DICPU|nr:uncharacterized protein DICPUDRAFT_156068 [Dictyostelium purpureum]EGC32005.1 hypothetical protein DICPUDRAFT_156068 [Dictyostelium purpureum]|eukprot:XP_003291461.1 hypothetical protein DICPUDRAFT_156068 [Dictyostelium purpureum]